MNSGINRALVAFVLLSCGFSAAAGEMMIKDPWVRAAPPNAPALGAFMVLENHGDAGKSVVGARTTIDVERVELHRTMMVDDVMKMIPQEKIPVGAHDTTVLKPGSWHVMLIGPKSVPQKGEKVGITLMFDDGSEHSVEAVVRPGKMHMQAQKHKAKQQMKHEMKHESNSQKQQKMNQQ